MSLCATLEKNATIYSHNTNLVGIFSEILHIFVQRECCCVWFYVTKVNVGLEKIKREKRVGVGNEVKENWKINWSEKKEKQSQ